MSWLQLSSDIEVLTLTRSIATFIVRLFASRPLLPLVPRAYHVRVIASVSSPTSLCSMSLSL